MYTVECNLMTLKMRKIRREHISTKVYGGKILFYFQKKIIFINQPWNGYLYKGYLWNSVVNMELLSAMQFLNAGWYGQKLSNTKS